MKLSASHFSTRIMTLAAIIASLTLTSCDNDEEPADPTARTPFLGYYDVMDQNSDESQVFNFTLQIKESSKGPDKVELKNFRYINNGLVGTIKGNQLIIKQVMEDSDERIEVTGQGTLVGDELVYSYKIVVKKNGKTSVYENSAEATRVE